MCGDFFLTIFHFTRKVEEIQNGLPLKSVLYSFKTKTNGILFIFFFSTEFWCEFSEQLGAANIGYHSCLFNFCAINHSIFIAVSMEVSNNQSVYFICVELYFFTNGNHKIRNKSMQRSTISIEQCKHNKIKMLSNDRIKSSKCSLEWNRIRL